MHLRMATLDRGRYNWSVACLWPTEWRKQVRHRYLHVSTLQDRRTMLRYSGILLVLAVIAAVHGFGGVASKATSTAQVLFFILLVLFVASLLLGYTLFRKK